MAGSCLVPTTGERSSHEHAASEHTHTQRTGTCVLFLTGKDIVTLLYNVLTFNFLVEVDNIAMHAIPPPRPLAGWTRTWPVQA